MRKKSNKSKTAHGVAVQRLVGRLEKRVIEAARQTAYMITKAHDGDESYIDDENVLVEAVEALDNWKKRNHTNKTTL